ncbi:MAG: hypothetical protein M1834_001561 [Cirrosporium novae-zelandiae]|nr:MAG: hypothetical protein M1834_004078 [Cirrosporium novae-zelandiae]KAI9735546.1 MAG: hypothetical protein M1834_001561 [Cirrosporium novae-zelandiae]
MEQQDMKHELGSEDTKHQVLKPTERPPFEGLALPTIPNNPALKIQSVRQAEEWLSRHARVGSQQTIRADDETIPRSPRQQAYFVALMVASLEDMATAEDNQKAQETYKRGQKGKEFLEAHSWRMLDFMMKKFEVGMGSLLSIPRGENGNTFKERWYNMCRVVKARKSIARRLLDEPMLESFVQDPLHHGWRARNNQSLNGSKAEIFKLGTQVRLEQEKQQPEGGGPKKRVSKKRKRAVVSSGRHPPPCSISTPAPDTPPLISTPAPIMMRPDSYDPISNTPIDPALEPENSMLAVNSVDTNNRPAISHVEHDHNKYNLNLFGNQVGGYSGNFYNTPATQLSYNTPAVETEQNYRCPYCQLPTSFANIASLVNHTQLAHVQQLAQNDTLIKNVQTEMGNNFLTDHAISLEAPTYPLTGPENYGNGLSDHISNAFTNHSGTNYSVRNNLIPQNINNDINAFPMVQAGNGGYLGSDISDIDDNTMSDSDLELSRLLQAAINDDGTLKTPQPLPQSIPMDGNSQYLSQMATPQTQPTTSAYSTPSGNNYSQGYSMKPLQDAYNESSLALTLNPDHQQISSQVFNGSMGIQNVQDLEPSFYGQPGFYNSWAANTHQNGGSYECDSYDAMKYGENKRRRC